MILVGADGQLVETVRQATLFASGGRLVQATLKDLATSAAELRPYAIVVPREVYDFGGGELDALAKDVGAGLLVVAHTIQVELLITSLGDEAARLG